MRSISNPWEDVLLVMPYCILGGTLFCELCVCIRLLSEVCLFLSVTKSLLMFSNHYID